MNYINFQVIDVRCSERDVCCYDEFNPEDDQSTEEYREELIEMSIEELIEETSTVEGYTLDEWMENWGQ